MDVEMFFVKIRDVELLRDVIARRVELPPDLPDGQPNWGLPNSYDVVVADHANRKIAVSPAVNGWVSGIESTNVVDFELLRRLSEDLRADVLAVQVSEATGSCGYAWCLEGHLLEHHFSGNEPDPAGRIRRYLRLHGVTLDLLTFQEAAQMHVYGWRIL
jgi:hypothetical protein